MNFSLVGFIVGAAVALIFYWIFGAIAPYFHGKWIVDGLLALLVWGGFTFRWGGRLTF